MKNERALSLIIIESETVAATVDLQARGTLAGVLGLFVLLGRARSHEGRSFDEVVVVGLSVLWIELMIVVGLRKD